MYLIKEDRAGLELSLAKGCKVTVMLPYSQAGVTGSEVRALQMYDVAVFFGFIAFLMLPCVVTLLSRARREEGNLRTISGRTRSSDRSSNPVFIAPVRRDIAFLTARAK